MNILPQKTAIITFLCSCGSVDSQKQTSRLYRCFCRRRCKREDRGRGRNIQRQSNTHRIWLAISFSRLCEVSYVLAVADNSSKILSLSPSRRLKEELLNQYVYIYSELNTGATNHSSLLNIQPNPLTQSEAADEFIYV